MSVVRSKPGGTTRVPASGIHSLLIGIDCALLIREHSSLPNNRPGPTRGTATGCQEATMQSIDSMTLAIQIWRMEKHFSARIAGWTAALFLLFIFAVPVRAQFGASLAGTVLDPTGASIPQATVSLINPATQVTQISTTNDTGAYHFNELAPGQYTLQVAAPGFKSNNITDLALAAETPRSLNVTLQPGGSTESVQVNGDLVPLLQTSD